MNEPSRNPNKKLAAISWAAQIVLVVILGQTLFFKFTYAPETAYIFEGRGGRPAATLVGFGELASVILLLSSRRAAIGAALALVLIGGAIFTHLTSLGISVKDPTTGESDGGLLFVLALIVAFGALIVLTIRRRDLPIIGRIFNTDGGADSITASPVGQNIEHKERLG